MGFGEDEIEGSNITSNVGPSSKKPIFAASKSSNAPKTVKPTIRATMGGQESASVSASKPIILNSG